MKQILLIIAILLLVAGGLYIFSPYFVPILTPEQAAQKYLEMEEERMNRKAAEDEKLRSENALPNLTVSEITETPNLYDTRLVQVRGCVVLGFETFALIDCEAENLDNSIELFKIDSILNTEKALRTRMHWRTPLPPTESQAEMLEFILGNENKLTPVIIEGEFQSGQGPYSHRVYSKNCLLIHRVIEVTSP